MMAVKPLLKSSSPQVQHVAGTVAEAHDQYARYSALHCSAERESNFTAYMTTWSMRQDGAGHMCTAEIKVCFAACTCFWVHILGK